MPKAIVTAGVYAYHEKSEDPTTPAHEARKGDEIEVSEAEFKRGTALHEATGVGLVKPKSPDAKAAKGEAAAAAEADPAGTAAAAGEPPPEP